MKVVLLKNEDATALLDELALAKFQPGMLISYDTQDLTEEKRKLILDSFHRHFHYHVVRWLQAHGFDTVRN
jgi:hypothetical protein